MFTVLTHNFFKIKLVVADRKSVTNKRMIDFSPKSIDLKFNLRYGIICKLFFLILLVAWSYPHITVLSSKASP